MLVGEDGGGALLQSRRQQRELERVCDEVAVSISGLLGGDGRCDVYNLVVGIFQAERPHCPVPISLQVREIH